MMKCLSILCLVSLAFLLPVRAEDVSPEHIAFFESKIRPVLSEKCYGCHSAQAKEKGKLKASLFVDSREGLLTGGDSGPALVAGQPEESMIIKVLRHQVKDAEMPPKGKLPDEVISDFVKWIAMGAPDPRKGEGTVTSAKRVIDINEGKQWWAFQPLHKPALPSVKDQAWIRTPVDAFILNKLEAVGIAPNSVAAKEKLLRRVTFDLTGLAPSQEERTEFLNDTHRGRHWLDVVRYAESNGYEFDAFRPGAYHYRDWVIDALNSDMPYDQFIRMQLAGDKLKPGEYDGACAAGFLVAGPYPGQITAKTREKIRYDQLDDMVSTIGNGMLGLSMNCMRCHDHKFDPLPQKDYYGFAAALATTVQSASKIDLSYDETQKKLAEHERVGEPLRAALKKYEREELPQQFAAWRQNELPKMKSDAHWQLFAIQSATAQSARLITDREGHVIYAGNKAKDDIYTIKVITHQKGVRAIRLDALSDPSLPKKGPGLSDNGNFVLGDVQITARPLDTKSHTKPVKLDLKAGAVTFEQKRYEFALAVDNSPNTGWGVAPQMGRDHAGIFQIEGEPAGFEGGTEFDVQLRFSGFFGLGKLRLAFSTDAEAKLADNEDMQNLRELQTLVAEQAAPADMTPWFTRFDPRAQQLIAAVDAHERQRPRPVLTEVYTAKDGGEDVYLLRRGEVDRKEGKANTSFLEVLMPIADKEKKWTPEQPQQKVHPRVSLANWMTDAESGGGPLLARVMVNRMWRQHFGRGIVSTPNDFGSQGDRPTHPELLEWLAAELVDSGWSLKAVHRQILLSATYMQSGEVNETGAKLDPQNRLWWQRPARRLEAEAIRDALLQLGGRLDPVMHGPSETDVASLRRSVYLRVKRSELVPFLTMFDAPEPTQSIGDRGSTTLPTQALAVMNSPFVHDMATRLSAAVPTTSSTEEFITKTYQQALCREPTSSELQRMKAFIEMQQQLLGSKPDAAAQARREFCLALLCLNEFIYVD